MIEIHNQRFRNLTEQVAYLTSIVGQATDVVKNVQGIRTSASGLPSANSVPQGTTYAVGTTSPYQYYVSIGGSWVNLGKFPLKGDQGYDGQDGYSIYISSEPADNSTTVLHTTYLYDPVGITIKRGDVIIAGSDQNIFVVNNVSALPDIGVIWRASLIGPVGPQGPEGPQGPAGDPSSLYIQNGSADGALKGRNAGQCTQTNAMAFGASSQGTGSNSMAMGNTCKAGLAGTAVSAMAFGDHVESKTENGKFACGKYNADTAGNIFEVGIGTDNNNRANALAVDTSGNMTLAGNLTVNGTFPEPAAYVKSAVLSGAQITFTDQSDTASTLYIGAGSASGSVKAAGAGQVTANYAIAMGNSCQATGAYSIAMGNTSKAGLAGTATNAMAFGFHVESKTESYKFACGKYNEDTAGNIFEVGIGTDDNNRANAVEVDTSGNMTVVGYIASSDEVLANQMTCTYLQVQSHDYGPQTININGIDYVLLAQQS